MKRNSGVIAALFVFSRWLHKFSWETLNGAGFILWFWGFLYLWATVVDPMGPRNVPRELTPIQVTISLVAINSIAIGFGLHIFAVCSAIRRFISRSNVTRDDAP